MKLNFQWASCKNPKTRSFRAAGDEMFKTVNSMFLDETMEYSCCFTTSSELATSRCFSTTDQYCYETSEELEAAAESVEMVVKGVLKSSSERLFFEPGGSSCSILEEAKAAAAPWVKESVALAVESDDPYRDFRLSMEEMVEGHGVKEWEGLEELLGCYLRVNGKNNHGFIVGAFVDLLLSMAAAASAPPPSEISESEISASSSASFYSTAASSFPSSPWGST